MISDYSCAEPDFALKHRCKAEEIIIIYTTMKKLPIRPTFILFMLVFASSCELGPEKLALTDPNVPIEVADGEEFQIIVSHAGCATEIVPGGVLTYGNSQTMLTFVEKETRNIKTPDFEGDVEILTFRAHNVGSARLDLGCSIVPDPSQGLTGGSVPYLDFAVNVH